MLGRALGDEKVAAGAMAPLIPFISLQYRGWNGIGRAMSARFRDPCKPLDYHENSSDPGKGNVPAAVPLVNVAKT